MNAQQLIKHLGIESVASTNETHVVYPLTHLYEETGPGKSDTIDIEKQAHIYFHNATGKYMLEVGYHIYIAGTDEFVVTHRNSAIDIDELTTQVKALYCTY